MNQLRHMKTFFKVMYLILPVALVISIFATFWDLYKDQPEYITVTMYTFLCSFCSFMFGCMGGLMSVALSQYRKEFFNEK